MITNRSLRFRFYNSVLARVLYGKCGQTCGDDICQLSNRHYFYCEGKKHGWSYREGSELPDCPDHTLDPVWGHSLSVNALVEHPSSEEPTRAWQYGVTGYLNGEETPYDFGDQSWVADGRAAKEVGGKTMVRDVFISYGEWREPNQ